MANTIRYVWLLINSSFFSNNQYHKLLKGSYETPIQKEGIEPGCAEVYCVIKNQCNTYNLQIKFAPSYLYVITLCKVVTNLLISPFLKI